MAMIDRLLEGAKVAARAVMGSTASKRDRLAALKDLRDEIDILTDALRNDGVPMDDDDQD